jgi:HD-GYP domain-containing protein (c-di-GMP phosphodiesterase class II)
MGTMGQCLQELERSFDLTLEAVGEMIDLKEPGPRGHSKRVAAYTVAIARGMGFATESIRVLARGAFLHDIGMLALADTIFQKPSSLTLSETSVVREHCALGFQLLGNIPFLVEASHIVYSHHEFYDGTGYPRGLKDEKIPVGARIVAVADAVDAITSERPYRAKRTMAAAKKEIERWRGCQFDPNVVDAFVQLPDNLWADLRREIS